MKAAHTDTLARKDGGNDPAAKGTDPFKPFLGDYKISAAIDNLAFGTFIKHQIDLGKSPEAAKYLADKFGAVKAGDQFFTLSFKGVGFALVKKDAAGAISAGKIVDDITGIPLDAIIEMTAEEKAQGITLADVLVRDFVVLEQRSAVAVTERMTVEFSELRDYVYDLAKEVGRDKAKDVGLALAGGKGLSLSVMSKVVDVPPGYNVCTTAYFKFVKDNQNVWNKIFNELGSLDTMDDQKRDVVASDIRETIKNSPIPEDIKAEVVAMYHQMNVIRFLAHKQAPTPVAVRSSGTKEDIHVKTWLPVSTGSQAGQSDTFLNVKGDRDVLDKLRADWASLFTDRAISYRDDATFLMFSGAIDYDGKSSQDNYWTIVAKLREYAKKLNKPEYLISADLMSKITSPNPGSVNLMDALKDILSHEENPVLQNALKALKEKSEEVVHPEKIGIDVVILQMVQSDMSGVLFTVNPATKMAGVAQGLYNAWFLGDDSLVFRDKETGEIIGTKPCVVSWEQAPGFGETVVGGKVDPDKYIMGTYDGKNWFMIEKRKGSKLIQMKNREQVVALLSDKIDSAKISSLAGQVKEAVAYDEVGKKINGILATKLHGIKYLSPLPSSAKPETEKEKKARVQKIAQEIATMVKDKESEAAIIAYIKKNFEVVAQKGYPGIQEADLADTVRAVFTKVQEAQAASDRGMHQLANVLGSLGRADTFIHMVKEVWENKEYKDLKGRSEVLGVLGLSTTDLRNLSYCMRSIIDESHTSLYETTETHRNSFTMPDDQAPHLARMAWAIAGFYKDARDIEFAIEIDATTPADKQMKMYTIDDRGNVMGMNDKGELVAVKDHKDAKPATLHLYNVQARPYTADVLGVEVVRARSEIDEKYLDEFNPKPIVSGTKGENATHGFTLVYNTNKDVAWHADEIRRLMSGEFTEEEEKQIAADGFNLCRLRAYRVSTASDHPLSSRRRSGP